MPIARGAPRGGAVTAAGPSPLPRGMVKRGRPTVTAPVPPHVLADLVREVQTVLAKPASKEDETECVFVFNRAMDALEQVQVTAPALPHGGGPLGGPGVRVPAVASTPLAVIDRLTTAGCLNRIAAFYFGAKMHSLSETLFRESYTMYADMGKSTGGDASGDKGEDEGEDEGATAADVQLGGASAGESREDNGGEAGHTGKGKAAVTATATVTSTATVAEAAVVGPDKVGPAAGGRGCDKRVQMLNVLRNLSLSLGAQGKHEEAKKAWDQAASIATQVAAARGV